MARNWDQCRVCPATVSGRVSGISRGECWEGCGCVHLAVKCRVTEAGPRTVCYTSGSAAGWLQGHRRPGLTAQRQSHMGGPGCVLSDQNQGTQAPV